MSSWCRPSASRPEGGALVLMDFWLQLSLSESWHGGSVRPRSDWAPRGCSFTLRCPDGRQLLLQSIFHHGVKGDAERDDWAVSLSRLSCSVPAFEEMILFIFVLAATTKARRENNLDISRPGCTRKNNWRWKSPVLKVSVKMKYPQ
ncbi:hypothetical protein CgunFtcFv8_015266 [Champsocephalus gunnari]|uniref:Uncharacterized protein n=1 Tax=Champsocephalus gunnari TaxID=52237 RepID=A0AAN8C651_CHAGU|nr:hypothetical protein CgunFtcFv8_015266 [Champsocephalus gunnari]